MSALTKDEKRALKAAAHGLRVVLQSGTRGVTEAFVAEVEHAIDRHELIKVKLVANADDRKTMAESLCAQLEAEHVAQIGQVAILYRMNPDRARYGVVTKRARRAA